MSISPLHRVLSDPGGTGPASSALGGPIGSDDGAAAEADVVLQRDRRSRYLPPLGQAAHAAAKGGVIGLTKTLAAEGAADGIRANVISPGFVASPATDAAVGDELRAFQLGMHLIRRPGQGDDIAYLAVYLASDESSWVTGQNYSVDGGVTAGFR